MRAKLLPLIAALLLPLPAAAADVLVFAAASLKTALDEVAESFGAASGDHIVISYAGSNALAQQIIAGAPAALFLSASEDWMDAVAAEGLLLADGRRNLLGNSLVLIGPAGSAPVTVDETLDLTGLLAGEKLAMGLVDAVPAGQYGKAALENLGLWEAVAPAVAQTDNVRAALALVAAGEAALGITYATDAAAEDAVSVIGSFPMSSHAPILYPAGLLDPSGEAFFAYLQTPDALDIFVSHGFTIPE